MDEIDLQLFVQTFTSFSYLYPKPIAIPLDSNLPNIQHHVNAVLSKQLASILNGYSSNKNEGVNTNPMTMTFECRPAENHCNRNDNKTTIILMKVGSPEDVERKKGLLVN